MFWEGCFAKFLKNFFIPHHTDIYKANWGVFLEISRKNFLPFTIRTFSYGFVRVFFEKLSPSLYAEKSTVLGPLFSKKIHSLVIRRKRPHFWAPQNESFLQKENLRSYPAKAKTIFAVISRVEIITAICKFITTVSLDVVLKL